MKESSLNFTELTWEDIYRISLSIVDPEISNANVEDRKFKLLSALWVHYQKICSTCLHDRNIHDKDIADNSAYEGSVKRVHKTVTADYSHPDTIIYEPESRKKGIHPGSNRVGNDQEMKKRGWYDCKNEVKSTLNKARKYKTIGDSENLLHLNPEELDASYMASYWIDDVTDEETDPYTEHLDSALASLKNQNTARAIRMKYYEKMTQKEIADVLGISESTLSENLKKACNRLQSTLTELTNYKNSI